MREGPYAGWTLLAVTLAVLASLWQAQDANAVTFEVTRTDDPAPNRCEASDCSLREAVIAANGRRGRDQVVLRSGKRYELTRSRTREDAARSGDLDVTEDLTVRSSGAGKAALEGVDIEALFASRRRHSSIRFSRLKLIGGDRGTIDSLGAVTLSESWVGRSRGAGVSARFVHLDRSVVRGHRSMGVDAYLEAIVERSKILGNGYGGIYVCRNFSMVESVVKRNTGGWMMGAIQLGDYDTSSPGCEYTRPFRIVRSRIVGNEADEDGSWGAVTAGRYSDGGLIRGSLIARNSGDHGAVEVDGVRLVRTRVLNNTNSASAGGAGGVTGSNVRIVRSIVAGNSGPTGGAFVDFSKVRGSTFSGNHAERNGGGLDVGYESTITNSTVANNTAQMSGGGIFANFGLLLRSATVAYNQADVDGTGVESGGGVFARTTDEDGGFVVENSLIAFNETGSPSVPQDCSGPFDTAHHNLLSAIDAECQGFDSPTNLVSADPRIGGLADNGGPTQTIALRRTSPAVGAASKRSSPRVDQRQVDRDRQPDIGAFERR